MKNLPARLYASVFLTLLGLTASTAQPAAPAPKASPFETATTEDELRQVINSNAISVVTGRATGTYIQLADNMARAVEGSAVRLLPMIGDGGGEWNIQDILYLRRVDLAFLKADALQTFEGKRFLGNLKNRLRYITSLYPEEIHLAADAGIASIRDLEGKVIACHGSGAVETGKVLFRELGVKPVRMIDMDMLEAAPRIGTGEVHAILRIAGKPLIQFKQLKAINPALRFVPIEYKTDLINSVFLPTTFTSKDYPDLVGARAIDTVAIQTVLAVYNWPADSDRYALLSKFVDAFFSNYDKMLASKGRHSKWDEVGLTASIAGWTRFQPAQDWLDRHHRIGKRRDFDQFLRSQAQRDAESLSPEEHQRLFEKFIKWENEKSAR